MKKVFLAPIFFLSLVTVYSQDTVSVINDTTATVSVATPSVITPKVIVQKDTVIQKETIIQQTPSTPVQPVIVQIPGNDASNTTLEATVDSLKSTLNPLGDNTANGVTIVGNNVIVGNNNTIIVLDDKSQLPDYLAGKFPAKDRSKKKYKASLFNHFSIGLKASTIGAGIELASTLSPNFQLRLGYNITDGLETGSFKLKTDDENLRNAVVGGYNPEYKTKAKFDYKNAHALIDFYPIRSSFFHITAGVYYGDSKVKSNGVLINPETENAVVFNDPTNIPPLNLADRELAINANGALNFDMELGNKFKPYAGIGFGRAVPKSRFGINFELGVIYQGDIDFSQNGVVLADQNDLAESFKNADDYTKWLKWYPVVSLQLVYRFN